MSTNQKNGALPPIVIDRLRIDPPLLLAPMAGITDLPFRRICRAYGVGLTVTEMIASRAVEQGRRRTERMALIDPDEHPVAIQIAGSDPGYLADAARWAADHGADLVDINMGCPVKKVCRQQAGSALLRDERQVARLLDAVVAAVELPVTLKIRTGWDQQSKNVDRIARIAEECGVRMLTVHGRTRSQMFHGHADWHDIGRAVEAVSIPVIGNGDVVDGASALELIRVSGCAGVMVGRAVQGNPWLLAEVAAALRGAPPPAPPDREARWAVVRRHMELLAEHHGRFLAGQLARKHVVWYSRGLPDAARFRACFQRLRDWPEQLACAEGYFLYGRLPPSDPLQTVTEAEERDRSWR
ncbi:MAG: tRNA dihydrouridine synthase DusB [Zetaproteobacteria bacterium]|nr:MAG: tRNA dihydrouridine synthase DusB [Zetaproteobacteria bacterium]